MGTEPQNVLAALAVILLTTLLLWERGRFYILSYISKTRVKSLQPEKEENSKSVSGLFVYPVKSLRAVPVQTSAIDNYGLKHDRRLMIVKPRPLPNKGYFSDNEPTHTFLTQRQAPSLTQICPSLPSQEDGTITLRVATKEEGGRVDKQDAPTIQLNISQEKAAKFESLQARLWEDNVQVSNVGQEAAKFVEKVLEKDIDESTGGAFANLRVAMMNPNNYHRDANKQYVPMAAMQNGRLPNVHLADGFPILLVSEASLEELNRRLKKKGKAPLPMARFRPNIVIKGCKPFEEDQWKIIKIGSTILHVVKGCPRCKESCTDQLTGEVTEEPLATMAEFRALGEDKTDVFFAQNAVAQDACGGSISVGDTVTVLKCGEPVYEGD